MSDFPETVFRVPGKHYGFDSRGFDYIGVNDADEMEAALADGWHQSIDAAIAALDSGAVIAEVAEAAEAVAAVSDDAREAMEVKARELGVSFNSRTSDKVLAERIAAAQ